MGKAAPTADTVQDVPGESQAVLQPVVYQTSATPDNTPVPGGGSWRWDTALSGWVSNDETTTQPAQE